MHRSLVMENWTAVSCSSACHLDHLKLKCMTGYNRTVLVIWPLWSDLDVRYGTHNLEGACQHIAAIQSTSPSDKELKLVEHALSKGTEHPFLVANAVSHAARQWRNHELWFRVVNTCSTEASGVDVLSLEHIQGAITVFSFQTVHPMYVKLIVCDAVKLMASLYRLEKMLDNEQKNVERFRFLDKLDAWVMTADNESLSEPIRTWTVSYRQKALDSLRLPQPGEQTFLLSLAVSNGGIEVLINRYVSSQSLSCVVGTYL